MRRDIHVNTNIYKFEVRLKILSKLILIDQEEFRKVKEFFDRDLTLVKRLKKINQCLKNKIIHIT